LPERDDISGDDNYVLELKNDGRGTSKQWQEAAFVGRLTGFSIILTRWLAGLTAKGIEIERRIVVLWRCIV